MNHNGLEKIGCLTDTIVIVLLALVAIILNHYCFFNALSFSLLMAG
jgi:hypothetical protein